MYEYDVMVAMFVAGLLSGAMLVCGVWARACKKREDR